MARNPRASVPPPAARPGAAAPSLQRIVWLASFPKSGNTWVRTFLANYFQPPGQTLDINSLRRFTTADVRRDFFDRAAGGSYRGRTIEDWLAVRPGALRLIAASKPGHHFVKTHCQIARIGGQDLIPPEVTAAAVYMIRNPFDIAPSYARHLNVDIDAAIGRMTDPAAIQGGPQYILEIVGRWDRHVIGWTGAPGLPRHVMRYEDIAADPAGAFRALFRFLRLGVDVDRLKRALDAASFDTLRRQEEERGFIERPPGMERFFHRGRPGGWRDELTPAQVARLRAEFLPTLEKWYPELVEETRSLAGREGA
ncbi:MAG TPA: sulfotransferase domain-containing protein [Thermohalobaculum sp.]|nr:sulfotransferase domain-containing protein [Thermohalobaculum sp.]